MLAPLRSSEYDETVLERFIDDEARSMLSIAFLPGRVANVATFIDALEESYRSAAEYRHQEGGYQKWLETVKKLRTKARVDFSNMNQLCFDIIGVLIHNIHIIGVSIAE